MQNNYSVGETVDVRDQLGSSWLSGTIKSVNPLEVQVTGWPLPMRFAFVRKTKVPKEEAPMGCHPVQTKKIWIPRDFAKHVIGTRGKRIKQMRRKLLPGSEIVVFDHETRRDDLFDDLDENYRVSNGHTGLVYVSGTEDEINSVQAAIRLLREKHFEHNRKYQAWLRRRYRVRAKENAVYPHLDLFYLKKTQHGANGSWHTRKFKNKLGRKGKARNPRKHYCHGNRKRLRKPNRKNTVELSRNRRLSY